MSRLKNKKGFTLIELVIVLAIAALILAAILIAVGGAQRARRDTQRKNNVGTLGSALEQYASDNGGLYPSPGTALSTNYTANLNDPLTGAAPTAGTAPQTATASTPVIYSTDASCGSGGATASSTNTRQYAISYWSESGKAAVCETNQ